jgi:hypothetical protein
MLKPVFGDETFNDSERFKCTITCKEVILPRKRMDALVVH